MPKPTKQPKQVSLPDSQEFAGLHTDSKTEFLPHKHMIKHAAVFGPAKEEDSGHYVSASGNHYLGTYHEDLVEYLNEHAPLGWPHHSKRTDTGALEYRDASEASHRIVPGTAHLDKDGSDPMVRADVEFIGKNKAHNYEIAEKGKHHLGFSVQVPKPLGHIDHRGNKVHEHLNFAEKRPISVDLVECSGATQNITESAEPINKETAMTPEQIQALTESILKGVDAKIDAKLTTLSPALESAAATEKKLKAIERANLIQSRILACQLDNADMTEALAGQLAVCESAELMDKLIRGHKEVIAKHTKPAINNGASSIEVKDLNTFDAVLEHCGYGNGRSATDRKEAAIKFQNTPMGKAVLSPAMESYADQAGAWSFLHRNDPEVAKQRKAFIESVGLRKLVERTIGRPCRTHQDVTEAAVDTSGFGVINTALLAGIIIDKYDIAGENLTVDEITHKYDSVLQSEVIPGYTAPGGLGVQNNQGDLAPAITIGQKGAQDHTINKIWARVIVTREEYLFDQKGLVIMRANTIAEQLRVARNLVKMLVITDQSNYTVGSLVPNLTQTSFQQYRPLVGTSYPVTSIFTASNTLYANPLNDYRNVEAAANLLKSLTDENGNRLYRNAARPLHVLIPDTLEFNFWHIFNAFGTQKRSADGMQAIEEGGNPFAGSVRIMDSTLSTIQAQTDTSATTKSGGDPVGTWYIAGAGGFQDAYVDKRVIPFEVVQIPQAEVQAVSADVIAGVKAAFKEDVVPRDPQKFIVKCVPLAKGSY